MKNAPQISVLIPTRNNEGTIQKVLDSVSWADEILVVDTFSTDQTASICSAAGARVIQHEYINSACQKNWALQHCQHEWVFQIDTDELLEDGFYEELMAKLSSVPDDVDAFQIPRKNHILGKWVKHAGIYPDYQKRLFRKEKGCWIDREVHAHVIAPGRVETFRHHILHYGMPNLSKQIRNLDRYTRYEADEMLKNGRQFNPLRLVFHPWRVFLTRYFLNAGYRDGVRGFIFSAYMAMYDFLSIAKLWEIEILDLPHSPRS